MKDIDWNEAVTLASPHPYALATTLDEAGRPNAIGLGWWTIVSWEPPLVAISVAPGRYSHAALLRSGEFGLCLPARDQARGAWVCGTKSGRKVDKLAVAGLSTVPSTVIAPPLISGCTVAFECKVSSSSTVGDHTLFVAEVVATHGDPERRSHLYSIHYRKLIALSGEGEIDFDLVHK